MERYIWFCFVIGCMRSITKDFLNFVAFIIPAIEDAILGIGTNIEPNIEIDKNMEYTIPLLVGCSKILAIPKVITRPIPTI